MAERRVAPARGSGGADARSQGPNAMARRPWQHASLAAHRAGGRGRDSAELAGRAGHRARWSGRKRTERPDV
eukprot:6905773-Pyramimonas_sp.AAC.1